MAIVMARPALAPIIEPDPIAIELVALPKPAPPGASAPAAKAPEKPVKPDKPAARLVTRPAPVKTKVAPVAAAPVKAQIPTPAPAIELTEAQLAGATTAGADSGSGTGAGQGGGADCNMIRRLQRALRKDAMVQAAVARAHQQGGTSGKAMLVWNGDWVRNPAEDGNGLAGVREAIMVEVAFAPEACRRDPVNGLVLISLNDAPGSPRLVLGQGRWKWSDLLFAR